MYFDQIKGGRDLVIRVAELEGTVHDLSSELKDVKRDLACKNDAAKDMRRQIDEANEFADQFKRAAERFKKDFWSEREAGAEAGAEMAKIRNENRMLVDGVNRRAAEITRQQDRVLRLLGEIRERDAKIKNQRETLADLNRAHNEALETLLERRSQIADLRGRVRQGTAEVNAAFIAPALDKMLGDQDAEELRDELTRTQEKLHEAKTSRDYWLSFGNEQAEKLRAAEEHAAEAENKLDDARRVAENDVMDAHRKVAYIRRILRP